MRQGAVCQQFEHKTVHRLLFMLEQNTRAMLHTGRYGTGYSGYSLGGYYGMEFSAVLLFGTRFS